MRGGSIQGIWNLKAKHNAASQISEALGACTGSVPVNLTARANKCRARARHCTTCTVWEPKELPISRWGQFVEVPFCITMGGTMDRDVGGHLAPPPPLHTLPIGLKRP